MNEPSRWRQTMAHRLAAIYARNPHIAAVLVGGSSARGHADRFSDIELGVFWHRPPTDGERADAIAEAGGDISRLYPYDPDEELWGDDFTMGRAAPDQPGSGVLIEAGHYTVDFMNRTFESVLHRHDPDELKQNLVSAVVDGVPLHNLSLIRDWQQRARPYPDELAVAVIDRHGIIDHFWRWEMYLHRRQNLMLLYQSFSQVELKILHMLLAVNHVYYFGFKWWEVVAQRLPIAPPHLVDRLRRVYQDEPTEGARQLAALVEETFDLVEQRVPTVDVGRLRGFFHYRRSFWEGQPPGAG